MILISLMTSALLRGQNWATTYLTHHWPSAYPLRDCLAVSLTCDDQGSTMDLVAGVSFQIGNRFLPLKLVRYERQIGHRVTQGAGLFVIEDGKVLRTFSTVGNPHDGEAAALEAQAPKLIEDMQSGK